MIAQFCAVYFFVCGVSYDRCVQNTTYSIEVMECVLPARTVDEVRGCGVSC